MYRLMRTKRYKLTMKKPINLKKKTKKDGNHILSFKCITVKSMQAYRQIESYFWKMDNLTSLRQWPICRMSIKLLIY
jgi:hypothetical protein